MLTGFRILRLASSSDDTISTSIGSLVGGVLLPLDEAEPPIADEFNARKFMDLDSGVHGSWEEDN